MKEASPVLINIIDFIPPIHSWLLNRQVSFKGIELSFYDFRWIGDLVYFLKIWPNESDCLRFQPIGLSYLQLLWFFSYVARTPPPPKKKQTKAENDKTKQTKKPYNFDIVSVYDQTLPWFFAAGKVASLAQQFSNYTLESAGELFYLTCHSWPHPNELN